MPEPTQAAPPSELPPVTTPPAQPAVDPEVARLRAELDRNRKEFDALKQRVVAPPQPAATPTANMSPADMAREFYRDPVGHSVAIAQRAAQAAVEQVQTLNQPTMIQMARDSVRAKDPKIFDKYQLEIEAAVDTVAPQFRSNVNVWENALKMVKGNHIDEIIAERHQEAANRAPAVHISTGDGPAPASARSAAAPAGSELTADEKRTAKKLGLTEDQYKEGKKHYEEQSDPVRDPVGKSSWDNYITFDSRERRRKLRAQQQQRRAS